MAENRASKKQRELLNFIEGFIKGYGYGPSYREIMRALDYRSVSTVAVHVDGLIQRGLLRKKDNSARSLEIVDHSDLAVHEDSHVVWLKREIKKRKSSELIDVVKDTQILEKALAILLDQKGS